MPIIRSRNQALSDALAAGKAVMARRREHICPKCKVKRDHDVYIKLPVIQTGIRGATGDVKRRCSCGGEVS